MIPKMTYNMILVTCVFLSFISTSKGGLFPFGTAHNDTEGKTKMKQVNPILMSGILYDKVVYGNAFTQFLTADSQAFMFTPFHSNGLMTIGGTLWHRINTDSDMFRDVIRGKTGNCEYTADYSILLTMENMIYYYQPGRMNDTYQIAITTDYSTNHTYVIYVYGSIQSVSNGKAFIKRSDAVMIPQYTFYLPTGSEDSSLDFMNTIVKSSNVGENGMWIFRVDGEPFQDGIQGVCPPKAIGARIAASDGYPIENGTLMRFTSGETVNVICTLNETMRGFTNATVECDSETHTSNGIESSVELSVTKDLHMSTCKCYADKFPTVDVAQFTVMVADPAMITSFSVNNMADQVEIDVGDSLEFACMTEGLPKPDVLITGVLSKETLTGHVSSPNSYTNKFQKTKIAACEDSDHYKCTSYNGVTAQQMVTVLVKCEPAVFEPANPPAPASMTSNGQFIFSVDITARPSPTVFILTKYRVNSIRGKISIERPVRVEPSSFIATFKRVNVAYGTVTVAGYDRDADDNAQYNLNIDNLLDVKFNVTFTPDGKDKDGSDWSIGSLIVVSIVAVAILLFVSSLAYFYYNWMNGKIQKTTRMRQERRHERKRCEREMGASVNARGHDSRLWRDRMGF